MERLLTLTRCWTIHASLHVWMHTSHDVLGPKWVCLFRTGDSQLGNARWGHPTGECERRCVARWRTALRALGCLCVLCACVFGCVSVFLNVWCVCVNFPTRYNAPIFKGEREREREREAESETASMIHGQQARPLNLQTSQQRDASTQTIHEHMRRHGAPHRIAGEYALPDGYSGLGSMRSPMGTPQVGNTYFSMGNPHWQVYAPPMGNSHWGVYSLGIPTRGVYTPQWGLPIWEYVLNPK